MVDGEAKSGGGGADGSPNNVAMPHEFEAYVACLPCMAESGIGAQRRLHATYTRTLCYGRQHHGQCRCG